jgi:hypothetical protein
VVDLAPVREGGQALWLVLGEDGRISRWDLATGEHATLAYSTVPVEGDDDGRPDERIRRRLHAAADGRFAAVVNDYGRFGQVLDLRSGEVTLALDNQGGEAWTVPFSMAFAQFGKQCVVVHRTDWNRLDISDPVTGRLLTGRTDSEPADHYLDYYHGALHVSPDCQRILDDGWVWHPVGIPAVWDLGRWLGENAWESEDGPSRADLCDRTYYWNQPMTWIDSTRVAVGGLGDDADDIRPGVRVFDTAAAGRRDTPGQLREAVELLAFNGPAGHLFSDGTRLFGSDSSGLSAWDRTDGTLLGVLPGFAPTHHHPDARQFLQLTDGVARLLEY